MIAGESYSTVEKVKIVFLGGAAEWSQKVSIRVSVFFYRKILSLFSIFCYCTNRVTVPLFLYRATVCEPNEKEGKKKGILIKDRYFNALIPTLIKLSISTIVIIPLTNIIIECNLKKFVVYCDLL